MSKTDRERKRRLNKQRFEELAGLGLSVKPPRKRAQAREPSGRFVADPHPRATVLEARARQMRVSQEDADLPLYVDQPGRAIILGAKDARDRARLWQTYIRWDIIRETFRHRYLGISSHPKAANLDTMPGDPVDVRPDDRPDPRSPEEKDRDACRKSEKWDGYLARLTRHEKDILESGIDGQSCLVQDGKLTTAGGSFVAAMRALAGVAGM